MEERDPTVAAFLTHLTHSFKRIPLAH